MWLVGTQRRLPSPGLQVEVVILDHDTPIPRKKAAEGTGSQSAGGATEASAGSVGQEKAGAEEGSRAAEAADAGGDAKGTGVDASNGEGYEDMVVSIESCSCFICVVVSFSGRQFSTSPLCTNTARVLGRIVDAAGWYCGDSVSVRRC
jgi:hypothetical protein